MSTLPAWAEHALNGSSHRVAERWFAEPDDQVAGEIMQRGREQPTRFNRDGAEYLDLKVEVGTAAGGERQLCKGEWVRVHCGCAQLRDWLARDDPQPEDKVAIRYVGLLKFGDGTTKHRYIAGTAAREEGEPVGVLANTASDGEEW
jgi:hypothetical protein